MADDSIVTYTRRVSDGDRAYCPACVKSVGVWEGVTKSGEVLQCCGICQRILSRKPAVIKR